MAEDVILSVKNISKSFGDLQVLKEIGFDIHKGEKIAILGLSLIHIFSLRLFRLSMHCSAR